VEVMIPEPPDTTEHLTKSAGRSLARPRARGRKVRAPQGKVLANGQAGRLDGQCHRKQTAAGLER
jgi:hypothetical protein